MTSIRIVLNLEICEWLDACSKKVKVEPIPALVPPPRVRQLLIGQDGGQQVLGLLDPHVEFLPELTPRGQ